jgi:transposase InsO family protein
VSQACGSMPFILAVTIRLYMAAARRPPRSEPQNNQAFRPSAMPLRPRSAALFEANPPLFHHSDRGVQYVSIKYTERLAEAGIEPSVSSVGHYDNALAETINGLYKAEVIHRRGPWRSCEAVEYATLEWVDWFNNQQPAALGAHRQHSAGRSRGTLLCSERGIRYSCATQIQ